MDKLWPEGVRWLRKLVYQFEAETSVARRDKLKRVRRAREFWKGSQFLYYDELAQRWKIPGMDAVSQKQADLLPRYQFITNIYQAYGLTLISILSQGNPVTMWLPVDPSDPVDMKTAKSATKVARLFRRNNRIPDMLIDLLYYLFNDGTAYGYVRWVQDEDTYGAEDVPQLSSENVPLTDSTGTCALCGWQGELPSTQSPDGNAACPQCGAPLSKESVQPGASAPVPVQTGQQSFANGQEELEILSDLEVVTPVFAKNQKAMPFLTWSAEIHRAKLQATYPWVRDKLEEQAGGEMGDSTARAQEKQTRVSLMESSSQSSRIGSELASSLVTFRRTWFRPWAFEAIKDKQIRARMKQVFPKGCYVAFAGDTYCESRLEKMDDHWRIIHAFPGEGQNREAVGGSLISVQRRHNTIDNILIETIEYGVPTTWVDDMVVDTVAYNEAGAIPGLTFPAEPRPGVALQNSFYQTQPAKVSAEAVQHLKDLRTDVAQFLTGAFPALFGGDTGQNDTFHGIAEQRDQALGRIGMIWRKIVSFLAECDYLGLLCFRENRDSDVQMAVEGDGGIDTDMIQLDDLQGSVKAYPDPTESYPITFDKKKAALEALSQSENPSISGLFSKPANMSAYLRYEGMSDELEIPGEAAREAELRKIREMTAPGVQPVPDMTQMPDPVTQQPQFTTTEPVDPIMDDPETVIQTGLEWAASDNGQAVRKTNPGGWANVRLRIQMAQGILAQQAQAAQAQAQPPTPQPEASAAPN